MNIGRNLERSALYFPRRPALSEGSAVITYEELDNLANRVATSLIRMGVRPGDHIGLCAQNSVDWVIFYFGVLKAGAVVIALSALLKREELSFLISHCKPRLVFTDNDKIDDLSGLRHEGILEKIIAPASEVTLQELIDGGKGDFKALDRDRTDTAVVLYTGGTTGAPKGVELSHENINAAINTIVFNERSLETDRALCFLPFSHVFGQMHILNATILSGGSLELLPSFDMDKVLYLLGSGRVTKLFAVPTIYVRFLALEGLKEKIGAVRYCFSAAASMSAELVRQWRERTDLGIYEGYGMTEAAPTVTYNHRYRHVIGSVGTEVPGVEIQIRDIRSGEPLGDGEEGEICVRGPNIMKGYLENPESTREAFWEGRWFRTGDIGRFDEDGYLYIVDRLKDMIITGGENVYSREVEEALYTRPEIQECAVIGLPDPVWGERVAAFIIPKPGKTIEEESLKSYLKTRLSPYKVPKEYVLVEDFPRSAAGKILKRELKHEVQEKRRKALAGISEGGK
ncbi:MAG: AMP-binding protein [Deltaproteobacteria bacterium]|nr:AMP-binding protein [Deltaproteobacteria bacterium]